MSRVGTFILLLSVCLMSCVTLEPVSIKKSSEDSLDKYKYFYINPSGDKTGSAGYVVGNQFGVFGGGKAKSTNPGDVITGSLMKQGYIRVAEIEESMKEKTFIVSYGETGRREVDLGYTIEVTIQFTSAKTHEIICTVSGEGYGETEADDVYDAVTRCMDTVFGIKRPERERESYY